MSRLTLWIILLLTLASCSARLGDFTILSSRNVELQGEHSLVQRNVEGSDGTTWLLLIIPIGKPNLRQAVDDMLARHQADFLTNVILYKRSWSIIIVGWDGFVITADAWRNGGAPMGSITDPSRVRGGRDYELVELSPGGKCQLVEKD